MIINYKYYNVLRVPKSTVNDFVSIDIKIINKNTFLDGVDFGYVFQLSYWNCLCYKCINGRIIHQIYKRNIDINI